MIPAYVEIEHEKQLSENSEDVTLTSAGSLALIKAMTSQALPVFNRDIGLGLGKRSCLLLSQLHFCLETP